MTVVDANYARNALVPLLLRITLGAIFVYHGLDKVTGSRYDWGSHWATRLWEQSSRPPQDVMEHLEAATRDHPEQREQIHEVAIMLQDSYARESGIIPTGVEYPLTQFLVAWGELLCGLAMFIGLLTRLAAALMIVVQLGAVATVTWQHGFSFAGGGGYEYNLALMAMCLALILSGSGTLLSLNRLVLHRVRGPAAASAAAPAATAAHHQPTA